MSYPTSNNITI